ncbi:class II glutamine amidotransferase [Nocardioides panaciterrulae]|uniref:Glutamine amidotransferase n=1 Tax=Nocardioides panaciterrulae TaxID=661492 RepID=A0A7Y9JBG3_9ACTN|nr:class II glutamine amidotransferase [Nocardioides panaciterrulae]NYD41169.1 glutamine amidotransferase [Nocardioides panaciterrulae]
MCRWMAYFGDPLPVEELLFRPQHSLIDQSLHSRLGATTTNGDGFGIGWYGDGPRPAVFKSIDPAWNDRNLRELAGQVSTRLFFDHVRASTGSAVQRSNCHPFRHDQWLWMHNGSIADFGLLKRDLVLAIEPALFSDLEGSTDSETLFFLALSFGLAEDPVRAVERTVGLVEDVAARHGVADPVQMTVATTDGSSMWCFRYSTAGRTRSLFYSTGVAELRALHPELEVLRELGDESRLVVSEPLRDLPDAWHEVPESSWGVVRPGADDLQPFRPIRPAA